MLILQSLAQLDAATSRAAVKKPHLQVIDFGEYRVSGSNGAWYTVTCKRDGAGNRLVYCSCEEKYPRKGNTVCYHIPPAVGAHMLLAIARQSAQIIYDAPQ